MKRARYGEWQKRCRYDDDTYGFDLHATFVAPINNHLFMSVYGLQVNGNKTEPGAVALSLSFEQIAWLRDQLTDWLDRNIAAEAIWEEKEREMKNEDSDS